MWSAVVLKDLIKKRSPTILLVDVEGAEEDFFHSKLPSELRIVIIELHPKKYPQQAVENRFIRVFDQGFTYETGGSNGAVVVVKR